MEGRISQYAQPNSSPQSIFFQSQPGAAVGRRSTVVSARVDVRKGKVVRPMSRTPSFQDQSTSVAKELTYQGEQNDKGKTKEVGSSSQVTNSTRGVKKNDKGDTEIKSRKGKEKETTRNNSSESFFNGLNKTKNDLNAVCNKLTAAKNKNSNGGGDGGTAKGSKGDKSASSSALDKETSVLARPPKGVPANARKKLPPTSSKIPALQQATPTGGPSKARKKKAQEKRIPVSSGSTQRTPKLPYSSSDTESSSDDDDDDSDRSVSADELELGSTPPDHKHSNYVDRGSLPPSSPPIRSQSHRTRRAKGKNKMPNETIDVRSSSPLTEPSTSQNARMLGKGVLIPASEEDLLTPRAERRTKGIKRSSEDMGTDSGEERTVKKGKKREKTKTNVPKYMKVYDNDDDDNTPRPVPTAKPKLNRANQPKAKNPPLTLSQQRRRVIESGSETDETPSEQQGHSFFQQLGKLSSDRDEVDYGVLDESADLTAVLEEGFDEEDELSSEDKAYLAPFKNTDDLCPYCAQPLPLKPSAHLKRLQSKLESMSKARPTDENPNARQLSWQQTINFCTLHQAEATIIPLGVRDGYPQNIDFMNLHDRLRRDWVGKELEGIIEEPTRSRLFKEVKDEVESVGRMRWGGIGHQSKEERLAAVKTGYYGELGRIVLTDNFQRFRSRGWLEPTIPPAKSSSSHTPSAIHPLTANDFITTILVPEASILLIMADRGAASFTEERYTDAAEIRAKSAKYGDWRFRADDEASQAVLEEIRRRAFREDEEEDKEKMGRRKKKKERKVHEVEDDDEGEKENRRPFDSSPPPSPLVSKKSLQQASVTGSSESIILLNSSPVPGTPTKPKRKVKKSKSKSDGPHRSSSISIVNEVLKDKHERESRSEGDDRPPMSSQTSATSYGDTWNDEQWQQAVDVL
ncbi:hypothetical protein CI109_101146 [Kwoniella shandongensis]|uniref:Restriction of telomere capping protein 4 n=1 Tax=Kwoniella shandongensis TaxID=1734106 RepID=A0A5M6C519_9TREE|nr:uncharacterized protein CI109_001615 [Kwoniella shandongensis]KAA5530208.1 hypothetical protein CI109_001615 [Kwoniella shandongensis]